MEKFRKLKANEIECRVGQTNESGFSLLLYKDARVDMNLLDEVVGPARWQRKHYMLGNDVYCSVGIYYDDIGWVWKDDAGASGTIEIEKSKASDSFKRACVNATGVGRELYTSPFIWVKKDQDNDPKKSHYLVKEIDYKENEISKLVIVNEKTGQVVFSKGSATKVSQTSEKPQKRDVLAEATKGIADTFVEDDGVMISQETKNKITSITGKYDTDKYNRFKTYMSNNFGVGSIAELTEHQGQQLYKALGGK